MKNIMRRSVTLLLVLAVCISLLPALTFTVDAAGDVEYQYSGNYVYNWGTREETATFLSPMAEDFYIENNITYEELAALSGSTSTSSVPDSALYKKLQNLMKSNQTYETSYNATRPLFMYTDCQQNGNWQNGKISSFYSGDPIGPAWDGGSTWNREHTWPNSKGDASGNGENDIMMLRPTAMTENSSRGNKAYGRTTSTDYYNPNDESDGKYDLRGDVARIMLFVYCRWGNTGSMWGASGVIESREVLLEWVEEDPVDTWELGRNDAVESITGTRNVFVDYPELIFIMFGEEIPEGMDTPSGNAKTCPHTNSIAVAAVAATCTTFGNTAGRYCNDCGKYYDGYSEIDAIGHSYSGVVTQPTETTGGYTTYTCGNCGDSYIADQTGPLGATYTVTFAVPDGVAAVTSMSCNNYGITLPAAGTPDSQYTFIGWTTAPVEDQTTAPTVYEAGAKFTTPTDTTLYALYTYGVGGSGVSEYVLTDISKIKDTDTVVITVAYEGTVYAMTNSNGTSAAPDAVIVSVSDDKLTATPADTLKWNIVNDASGYIIYPAGQTNKWLYSTSSNNGIRVGTNSAKVFTVQNNYLYNVAQGRYMGVYRTKPDWRGYTSINGNISNETYGFYVKTEAGVLHYTTLASDVPEDPCANGHDEIAHEAKTPTCTAIGWDAYVTCSRCDYSTYREKATLGHSWTDATCATPKTCSACGATEGEALGHSWTDATCATPKTCSACGKTEGEALGHSWTTVTCTTPKTCSVCGATEGEALGHNWINATCTASKTCTICGTTEGSAKGHTEVIDKAVAATCTTAGKTEGKHCSVCGTVIVVQQTIPAKNHNWKNTTCTTPKTCTTCGTTSGSANGHSWKNATCTTPKTCTTCGTTSGSANGHSWKAATCTTPKTCTTCGTTSGNANGHSWKVATCTSPKTCTTCGATTGVANGHTWRQATCTSPRTCTTCKLTEGSALGHNWKDATCDNPKICTRCHASSGRPAGHIYDNNVDGTCNVCNVNRENVEERVVVHMFRMYNPNTGEHFYTGSTEERDNLIAAGWQYEGIGFTFPANTGDPVHRLFQPSTGEHLYTMDVAEKDRLMAEGWNYEGIAFNSAYNTEAVQHRLHNPNATVGAYHFTFSEEEMNNLIAAGWEYQGIGWYSCWK